MMLLLLFAELIALYVLSRWLTKMMFECFFLVFRSRSVALTILLILTFPGTVVHELSHLFTAAILGVPTGRLTLEPRNLRGDDIKSGSVAIAETDPFRRYAIGIAPVVGGIIVLTAIAYFLPDLASKGLSAQAGLPFTGSPFWQNPSFYLLVLAGYLMFAVSNSMFSSPQDLKGFLPFAITLAVFIGAFYYLGLRVALTGAALEIAARILTTLVQSLGIVLAVNGLLLVLATLVSSLVSRATKTRIVQW